MIIAQAERQAINSTVQGSAADIAKKGMVLVQSRLRNAGYTLNSVASLALHLHDELLYEVRTHRFALRGGYILYTKSSPFTTNSDVPEANFSSTPFLLLAYTSPVCVL